MLNLSSEPIQCFITSFNRKEGNDAWYTINVSGEEKWTRNDGWELFVFMNAHGRVGFYREFHKHVFIQYYSLDNIDFDLD